jgi:hypothetical protein
VWRDAHPVEAPGFSREVLHYIILALARNVSIPRSVMRLEEMPDKQIVYNKLTDLKV